MLVIVQIETPVGVANAYDIAMVPGVDVLLGSNGDMTNFSGLRPDHPEYQNFFTKSRDADRSRPASFSAPFAATYAKAGPPGVGRAKLADWRLFYNGPSFNSYCSLREPERPASDPGISGRRGNPSSR